MRAAELGLALAFGCLAAPAAADESWTPFAETEVVHIVTQDDGGAERDTKVWLVVVDGAAFVRTNDSRWLANIRRGSAVALKLDSTPRAVTALEESDAATRERVEAAFLAKYGLRQRVLSALRMREPSVLRLTPRAP